MPRPRQALALAAASALLAGCFGSFNVTRNLYAFNRYVAQKDWPRTGLFLAMNVAPVYPVGVLMDVLLANPVEFWTGVNPIKDSERWFGSRVEVEVVDPATRRVAVTDPDGRTHRFVAVRGEDHVRVVTESGALLARLPAPAN